jgi:hypothetical protein
LNISWLKEIEVKDKVLIKFNMQKLLENQKQRVLTVIIQKEKYQPEVKN